MNLDKQAAAAVLVLPAQPKAVVVATGDDHGNGGTAGRFDQYTANSPAGCSVANWQCLRFTSYVYPEHAADATRRPRPTTRRASRSGCTRRTTAPTSRPTSLADSYSSQLSQLGAGVPEPARRR